MTKKASSKAPTKALIDGDILVYRIGFTTQTDEEWVAKARLNELITRIVDTVECSEFTVYLTSTDKSNFRFALSPEYKAQRKSAKPVHYEYIRKVLREDYGALTIEGEEADDAMGRAMVKDETVICTIDKDLDQIPGWHYNFVKESLYYIKPLEAKRWFYMQMLIGDVSDNIKGCPKIGKVKASRILEGATSEKEMFESVLNCYQEYAGKNWLSHLILAGNLLWIRRKDGSQWILPNGAPASKSELESFLALKE